MASEVSIQSLVSPYGFVRARQLEGTYPRDEGLWDTTFQRVLCGWGTVPASAWSDENWLNPEEPAGLDALAIQHRSWGYGRIRNSTDAIEVLSRGIPVSASLEIWPQWYHAERGIIEQVPDDFVPHESHCVTIERFLPEAQGFAFKNNWGIGWGDHGWGLLHAEYFDKWLVDCWDPMLFERPAKPRTNRGFYKDGFVYPLGDRDYTVFMIMDDATGEKLGWSVAVPRGGYFDVEEFYVRPQYRGKGLATALALDLKTVAEGHRWPLRMWVSFADCYPENHPNILKVASLLGLTIKKSEVPWAGYEGIPGDKPRRLPSIRIPARPKATYDEEASAVVLPNPPGPAEDEERLLRARARRSRLRQISEDL